MSGPAGAEPRGSIRLSGVIESKEYAGGLQRTRIQISDSLCLSTVSQTSELDGFAIGARVFHDKFGYGEVMDQEGNKLEIAFEQSGTKRVLDSFVTLA